MAFWLAARREGQASDWIQRFDPRFWTVNFPRPMNATVVSMAPDALRVEAVFLRQADLAGLIWTSADSLDHPLLAYATSRDYSRTILSFRWRSNGLIALDAVNGPTLTIEGRDQAGQARTWYVRLWNYAQGSGTDARIRLPFSALNGGFTLPAQADPVWPADIDRMFISLTAPGYDGASTRALAAPINAWAELTQIVCEGDGALLEIGDVVLPPHGLGIATGYDDQGTQTPARLLRNIRQLGYRGSVVLYVGMSHFFSLTGSGGTFLVGATPQAVNGPAASWHRAFFGECARLGFSPITSLSYEVLAQHCPDAWQQRAFDGSAARTGYDPPSALLSPASAPAMAWLRSVAIAFVGLMTAAGVRVRLQIGEPWWWITADGCICLYDAAAKAAFGGNPPNIADMRQPLSTAQLALLDLAGATLAASTSALTAAVRAATAPGSAEVVALVFTPTVLDPRTPEARRANLPVGWAAPAFDRLQVEDYDWLTAGADGARRTAYTVINQRLSYPSANQDYLAGYVPAADASGTQWRRIDAGIDEAGGRSPHERIVWALPQICRDGYVRLPPVQHQSHGDDDMQAFDDINYPFALGRDATIIPEFSTNVSVTASGFERRNSLWSNARLRFDVGPGIRSEAELGALIAFFRARRGAARGFRLRDPMDYSSNGVVGAVTASDQLLGLGDAMRTDFALIKRYGSGDAAQTRRITRPRANTLVVSVAGQMANGWALANGGTISFASAPAAGAEVRAGFLFDVPVRFADDKLEIAGAAFAAGDAPSVQVVEVREAA